MKSCSLRIRHGPRALLAQWSLVARPPIGGLSQHLHLPLMSRHILPLRLEMTLQSFPPANEHIKEVIVISILYREHVRRKRTSLVTAASSVRDRSSSLWWTRI